MDSGSDQTWRLGRGRELRLDGPRVMAILNVTPDSFSDGGSYPQLVHAVAAAERAVAEGAVVLDIGGESTRPGARAVPAEEQIRRVVPVIEAIRGRLGPGVFITVDTTRSAVARAALDAGADAVNDVSGGLDDEAMLPLVAERGCGVVLMHRPVRPEQDVWSFARSDRGRGVVVDEVRRVLEERVSTAKAAGIAVESIVIDPGLGFGKSVLENLELIAGTGRLLELGRPVLSGVSRKSFTAVAAGLSKDVPARERVHASVGLSVAHLHAGARLFRVHDVAAHVQALASAWRSCGVERARSSPRDG